MRRACSWTVSLTLACIGCAAPLGDEADASEEQDPELRERIAEVGYDPRSAVIGDDLIGVEGDVLLDRAALLAGDYLDDGEPDDALVDKGYWLSKVSGTNAGKIKLTFSSAAAANSTIVTAAKQAGASWSAGSGIDIRTSNTGASLQVNLVSSLPSGCSSIGLACAFLPSNGRPGAIYLKQDIRSLTNNCSWNSQIATFVIGHEMGHSIGMAHPSPSANWIAHDFVGTGSCDGWWQFGLPATTCDTLGLAPYDTVMHANGRGAIRSDCTVANPYLRDEDHLSAALLYPE